MKEDKKEEKKTNIKISLLIGLIFSIFAVIAILLNISPNVIASALANSNWPKQAGDLRNSSYINQNLSPYLTLSWLYPITNGQYLSPIVDSLGVAYFTTKSQLVAVNPNGTSKWSYSYGGVSGSGNYATPLLDGKGNIWVEGYSGSKILMYSIKSSDGTLNCTFDDNQSYSDAKSRSVSISPDGNVIYYPRFANGRMYAINENDCSLKWYSNFNSGSSENENIMPSVGSDGTIYIGYSNGVKAFNPSDGSLKWTYTSKSNIKSAPVLSPDETRLYFLATNPGRYLVSVKTSDGSEVWSNLLLSGSDYTYSQIGVDENGTIYSGVGPAVGTDTFKAFNPDGSLKWSNVSNIWTRNSLLIGSNYLYTFISTGGCCKKLYSLDRNLGTVKQTYIAPRSMNINDSGMQVAVDSNSNVYYPGSGQLAKLIPWTITASADTTYYKSGGSIAITAKSTMLKKDPDASEDNKVEAILPNSEKVLLQYSSTDGNNLSVWTGSWNIPQDTTDGSYSIRVEASQFKSITDIATNFDTAVTGSNNTGIYSTLSYSIDNRSPSGSISIDSGAKYTNTRNVTLNITSIDSLSGAKSMMISEDNTFSSSTWEAISTSKQITLTEPEGIKNVYLKLIDNSSNISETYSASIFLDSIPPTALKITKIGELKVTSDASPLSYYYLGEKANISGTGESGNIATFVFSGKSYTNTIGNDGVFSLDLGNTSLPDAKNEIEYYQTDLTGNVSPKKILILITGCSTNFPVNLQDKYCPSVIDTTTIESLSSASVESTNSIEILTSNISETSISSINSLSTNSNLVQITITVLDDNGNPVANALVVLHSNPIEAYTNKEGIATFSNVVKGEHTVNISYGNYYREEKLTIPTVPNLKGVSIVANPTEMKITETQIEKVPTVVSSPSIRVVILAVCTFVILIVITLYSIFKRKYSAKS
ncbi:MAG: PQQ-binding-like beta-propeller repeat protein [bacterium]